MSDEIIIGAVVAVVLGAHWWLFKWVKFKVEEGVIVKLLQETDEHRIYNAEAISSTTNITIERVSMVCRKSKYIKPDVGEKESWRLN